MATSLLHLLHFTPTPLPLPLPLLSPTRVSTITPRVSGGPHRKNPGPSSRFQFEDGFDEFEFVGSQNRTWWSDEDEWDDDDVEDDEDEGIWFWVFKVIGAFGWMVTAVTISLLLGTGPTPFLMALAVPLGQTALSLVFDKVWGSTFAGSKSRSRTRSRKKPFVRYANSARTRKTERTSAGTNKNEAGGNSYQSWAGTENASKKKGRERAGGFGGWDELDGLNYKAPRGGKSSPETNSSQESRSKLSRMGRVKDTPLLVRLLIAVFPFLGSWTRFLF